MLLRSTINNSTSSPCTLLRNWSRSTWSVCSLFSFLRTFICIRHLKHFFDEASHFIFRTARERLIDDNIIKKIFSISWGMKFLHLNSSDPDIFKLLKFYDYLLIQYLNKVFCELLAITSFVLLTIGVIENLPASNINMQALKCKVLS